MLVTITAPPTVADLLWLVDRCMEEEQIQSAHRLLGQLFRDDQLLPLFREIRTMTRQSGRPFTIEGISVASWYYLRADLLITESWEAPADVLDPNNDGFEDAAELLRIIDAQLAVKTAKGELRDKLLRARQALVDIVIREYDSLERIAADLEGLSPELRHRVLRPFRRFFPRSEDDPRADGS